MMGRFGEETAMARLKYGACLPTFASCAGRYCLSGYGGGADTIEGMLNLVASVAVCFLGDGAVNEGAFH